MTRQRSRRHSFCSSSPPNISVTMLHELRQFYDVSYRIFLVKAQLRTLAMNSLQLSPYLTRQEKVEAESKWLFSLVDMDDSGFIDGAELREMILKTGQMVKDEELELILSILDSDDSGEIDEVEFASWYGDDSDIWLSQRRKNPLDAYNDCNLLLRESMRFDPQILKNIDEFWKLVDVDGNGEIDLNEYIELSLHLQQNMLMHENKKSKKNVKFNEAEGIATAKKEWQMDSQGMQHLDYHRFQLCFFQIADAWSKSSTAAAYTKVLSDLLTITTVFDKGSGTRKWKWDRAGEDMSATREEPKVETPKAVKTPRTPKMENKSGDLHGIWLWNFSVFHMF